MKLTAHLRDCATLAAADGYVSLWVMVAGNSQWECYDVYQIADLDAEPMLTKRAAREPFESDAIAFRQLEFKYGELADAMREASEIADRLAVEESNQAAHVAAIKSLRSKLLESFRLYGQIPTTRDLMRADWTKSDWEAASASA